MENGALDHTDHYMIAIDYEGIRVLEDDCDKLDKKFIKICEEEPLKKENKE